MNLRQFWPIIQKLGHITKESPRRLFERMQISLYTCAMHECLGFDFGSIANKYTNDATTLNYAVVEESVTKCILVS